LYYIVFYVISFISGNNNFILIDFFNSILVLISFLLIFYIDLKIKQNQYLDNIFLAYLSYFLIGFISYYIFIFLEIKASFILFFAFLFVNILYYFYFQKLEFFKKNILVLRIISIIFSYISILLGFFIFIKY
jgi:hypothetical protein